jgi:Ion channel
LHIGFETDLGSQGRDFGDTLYYSGTTFVTLGLGYLTPGDEPSRFLTVVESAKGFAFLALVISYLLVLYQAFSRREVAISMLDARAGSPPSAGELLRRHGAAEDPNVLQAVLQDWERWAARGA